MPSTKEKNKFKNNVKAPAMKYSPVKRDNRSEIKTTPAKEENKSSGGSYASAKKNDPKLDSYIKARNDAKKSGDKSAQNAAQNKINKAYGKGPTNRPVQTKAEVDKKNEKKVSNTMRGSVDNKKTENPRTQEKTKKPSLRTNDPNKKVVTGFTRNELQIQANIMYTLNAIRWALEIQLAIVQMDIAIISAIFQEIASIPTIYLLLNEKEFKPNIETEIEKEKEQEITYFQL